MGEYSGFRAGKRVSITMNGIKQKSRRRRQKKRVQRHKRSVLAISSVILLLLVMVSVNGITLRAKEKSYVAQETELKKQIKEEKSRASKIDELEDYVGTDEYVEDVAREKLGLVHEGEIIFKAK